jgi:deazaflavin-dependent oxidoreductase (nitroreductase family)
MNHQKRATVTATLVITSILLVLAVYFVFLILALRLRVRPVIDAIRRFNKRIFNPAMMHLAGRRYWFADVLHHKGRRSGKQYATPVIAFRIDAGFVIPLTYGERVDWLKNVLAEGGTTIETKGETYVVVEPEVMDIPAVLPLLPALWRLLARFLMRTSGVDRCLRLRFRMIVLSTASSIKFCCASKSTCRKGAPQCPRS